MALLDFIPGLSSTVGKVVDKALSYIPDPEQREKARQAVMQMDLSSDAQQLQINIEEAKSEKWWKAGWRPFVGWGCGMAVWYTYLIAPFIVLIGRFWLPELTVPKLEMMELMTLLFGMLGLGYMRSKEKGI